MLTLHLSECVRQEKKERDALRKQLEMEMMTAPSAEKKFFEKQETGLSTEWAAVRDTGVWWLSSVRALASVGPIWTRRAWCTLHAAGERPWRVGERVQVFARRETRWSSLAVSQIGHPATVTRVNIDNSTDIAYLCVALRFARDRRVQTALKHEYTC
jgi:hypothetical protein